MTGLKNSTLWWKTIIIAIISQNAAAVTAVTVSYHLHHNICKIKLPNITSKCQRQHRASENILRVEDYYGFQMSSRRAMSSRCHGAEWPNFSLEHKARSLEASSNIRRNHSTHHPLFFGCLDSLQILFAWAVDKHWRIWILLNVVLWFLTFVLAGFC